MNTNTHDHAQRQKNDDDYKAGINNAVIRQQKAVVVAGCWQTCLTCIHWQKILTFEGTGQNAQESYECGLYKAVPPPEVIVYGCERHFQQIPF